MLFNEVIEKSIYEGQKREKNQNIYYISLLEAVEKYPDNFKNIRDYPEVINRSDIQIPICTKCNTPKRLFVSSIYENTSKKDGLVPIHCECENKRKEAEKLKKEKEKENIAVKNRLKECFSAFPIAQDFNNYFSSMQKNYATEKIDNFIENLEKIKSSIQVKKGIAFCGKPSMGKTYASMYLLHKLISAGYSAKYLPMQDFVNDVSKNAQYITELAKYDYLCIDDFRLSIVNPVTKEQFLSLLDKLKGNGNNLIFTTNLPKEIFKSESDDADCRIYSRMYAMCNFITVKGVNYRV